MYRRAPSTSVKYFVLVLFSMPVKRKVRAKSSKDSTPSPDDKRIRKEFDSVSSQTDDEVIEALNMAEDLGKKIEHVLLKLGKLDVIKSSLQEMNSTLANIEQTVSRLDEEVKCLKVKTNKTDEVVKILKENLEFNEEDISDLKRDSKEVQNEVLELKKHILYMETYSRRENAKFFGLPEESSTLNGEGRMQDGTQLPAEDSTEVIYNFLQEHLQIDRPRDKIVFQRVHRLGKPSAGAKSRPIIARFLRHGDKQLVMDRARKYLKNTAFNVYDDIPKPLYDSRKGQFKKLREAREKGYTAFFSKAHQDKLFVNGRYIPPGESV